MRNAKLLPDVPISFSSYFALGPQSDRAANTFKLDGSITGLNNGEQPQAGIRQASSSTKTLRSKKAHRNPSRFCLPDEKSDGLATEP